MARRPSPSASLRRRYPILLELSLVASLALCITLFATPLQMEREAIETLTVRHEVVQVEEIEQTRQVDLPPPPASMPPPIEVPDEDITETVVLDLDMDLDLNRTLAPPPPPPAAAPPPPEPEISEPEIFVIVEQMPELIGGIESLQARLHYPEIARRAGIEGVVHVQVVVNEDGTVSNPVVARGIGGGCDEAAIEAIRQARFTPGMQRGRPVRVRMSLPVRFRLSKGAS